ncbi:MFS transporter [Kitasatospora sp. MMS16-BH015]|uniref:MFS transporter n=1 Tax=Kitasatospora sp. MMS16-BH015 TaxID=2018025 RepID=UPI000CA352EC|nr:MFS transporter [Kitasatospora sp. MMS16-BH015]AUG80392.1 MFS transporter [Kitasatospora sp. MMS16-BH015]
MSPTPEKNPFVAVARDKAMRAPLLWSVLGRLPLYLMTVSIVVFSTSRGLSYFQAGLLLSAYSVGAALLAPFVARLVDRYGQPPVLLITGVVNPLALLGFVLADPKALALQLACMVVVGAAIPPISGCIRSLWNASGSIERAGLSLEAVLGEAFTIGGPLLFSLVLIWGSAGSALVVCALLTGAGALGFALTRASRGRKVTTITGKRDPLGALRSKPLVRLLVLLLAAGVSTGAYSVSMPAFIEAHGSADHVGLVFGMWGVGGILGGLWYGSRTFRRPTETVFAWALLVLGVASALVLVAWDNWSMSVALVVLGVIEAPVTALAYELISRTAREGYITEAHTWAITINVAGSAIGSQLGGLALGAYGTWAPFLGVVAGMLVAAALAFGARRLFAEAAEADAAPLAVPAG